MLRLGLETISKMPWYFPWSDAIKKRAIRYLLQRYVGQFLEEKLSLDQLTIDLYNGTGAIKELTLDVNALNEVADQLNLPVKFVDGFIGEISVSVPWHALLSESCFVEVSGLMVTIEPKQRSEDVSMVDSMIESMNMTTSMQIAQECLNHHEESEIEDINKDSSQMIEGIEHFAQAIDTVLNRIKVRFLDIIIRLEHTPKGSQSGVSLELRIKKVDYFDEAGLGKNTPTSESSRAGYEQPAFASKKFHIEGLTIYTDEFPAKSKTMAKSGIVTSDSNSSPESGGSKVSGDSFQTADTSPTESKEFEYNHEKTVCKLITNTSIPMEPILFAKLTGAQEISLKLKQADVAGPKVDLRMNCGSLIMFLSPRQIHLLMELSEGIASPNKVDIDADRHILTVKQKPMEAHDFQKVENELQKELRSKTFSSKALNLQQGWSVTPLEDSDDEFVPMSSGPSIGKNMSSSQLSGCSDMDSSFGSSMSGSTVKSATIGTPAAPQFRYTGAGVMIGDLGAPGKKKSDHDRKLMDDPSAVVTHFRMQISSLAAVILHEDILTPSLENANMVSKASVVEMQAKSEDFFSTLGLHGLSGYSYSVFNEAKQKFTDACPMNHLRFMAAPLTVEGSEKSLANKWEMCVNMSLGFAEMIECLVDTSVTPPKVEYSELLTFPQDSKEPNETIYGAAVEPKLRVHISKSQNMTATGRTRRLSIPKLDIKVTMGDCVSEIDMSIVDRISALINKQQVCTKAEEEIFSPELPPSYLNNQACFKQTLDDATLHPETRVNVKVSSSSLLVKLRFPIPDLRPTSNMDRVPWWKRNVRKDILSLKLQDFEFLTTMDPLQPYSSYEVRSGDIHVMFQEREEDTPISLLRASSSRGSEKGFDPPRVVVIVHPTQPWTSLEEEVPRHENIMTKSMMGFLEEVSDSEPSPFSRRKVATQQQNNGQAEELTIPAEKEEVLEFMENTLKNVQLHIDIHIPDVQLILPSKHIYEVIYNRLVTDLLLWEPSAPKPASHTTCNIVTAQGGLDLASVFMNESIYQSTTQFTMCASAHQDGSDSEDEPETQYYSVYEHKARQRLKQQQQQEQNRHRKQTQMAFKLTIGHGVASMRTPYRDSKNNVLPGQHGELMLVLDQGTVFAAVGYQGSPDLGYTCIWSEKVYLYHKAANITPDRPVILDPANPLSTSRLDAILYPNDPGVITKLGASAVKPEENQDQLNVALQMDFDLTRNLKTIVLAGCVRGTTLRHYMSTGPESWVTQIGDMFDVQDYPIAGYVLPDVVTEMNFHLWGCALDYRPLHLPLRTMLTVDACSIASNLTISSDANVLHFIIEDAALFLSDKMSLRTIDLRRDYVCVADLGVFELCLRMVEDLKEKKPKIDLTASNNVVHIRTCADSCRALLELLIYLASDGDLTQEASQNSEQVEMSPQTTPASVASSPSNDIATMRPSEMQETVFNPRMKENDSHQLEMVRGMMDDAMIESTPSTSSCEDDENDPNLYMKKGVEMFFFPDDNLKQKMAAAAVAAAAAAPTQKDQKASEAAVEGELSDTESALKEALKEASDNPFEECSSGTDEEFCILDDAPGTGIKSPSGEPQVRLLTHDPIIILDNHFTVPLGKIDQLRGPKHFPSAIMKYTLKELSVVWHIFGGSDFRPPEGSTTTKARRVTINDSNGNSEKVNFSTSGAVQNIGYAPEPSVVVRGGEVHFSSGHSSPTVYKKSPPQSPQQRSHLVWQGVGGPGRKHDTLMELQLSKVRFQHEIYPENAQQATRNVLLIQDIEIRDRLASSKINKFLYQFSSETCPRQAHANMLQVKALTSRPDGRHGPQETSLKISVQPIRLHIDQDALLFLFQFFEELLASDYDGEIGEEEKPQSAAQVQAPIMTVNLNQATQLSGDQQLLVNLEEKPPVPESEEDYSKVDENAPPYFKSFVFSPDVPIKIDYHGKHVDIHSQYGPIAGLLIGLGQLNQSEITLKSIVHKSGLLGMDKLINHITTEWANDIRRNQLPSVLGGVGPMHSVSKLVGGIRDLFLMPFEQYQKDGRLMRGLQRGTSAFTTSSAHAALDLTGRFVGTIQSAAEMMYDMVSSGPSVKYRYRVRGGQPQDIREGVTTAYSLMREGIGDTATAIVQAASQEHQHKGMSGAIGGVLRQIPPSMVQPIILASEAAGTVIGGMKNQLVPDARKEAADKWKA